MGDSVPQTPWDLTHYGQKHEERIRGNASHAAPMLLSPASALGLLPSKSPILRAGENRITELDEYTTNSNEKGIFEKSHDMLEKQE